jgi:hypothetical protein
VPTASELSLAADATMRGEQTCSSSSSSSSESPLELLESPLDSPSERSASASERSASASGWGEAIFCAKHKPAWHVDVRHRRCEGLDVAGRPCKKLPSFGHAEGAVPRFCRAHKHQDHVYVAARRHRVLKSPQKAKAL